MAEGDALEGVAVLFRNRRVGWHDAERPLRVRGGRRETQLRVARLVAEVSWQSDLARRSFRVDADGHSNRELPLEHGERLLLSHLLEVHGRRVDDLLDADAGRSIDGQNGRDERRVAWRIRLDVEAFGQRHAQRQHSGSAYSLAIGRGDRRNLGSRTLHLGIANRTGVHHGCEGEPNADMKPCCHHLQSNRGVRPMTSA